MSGLELLIGLLGVVAGIAWLARRLAVPYPVFLVIAGVLIGLVPGLPELEIEPEVILLVFIPPLVHAAAWTSSPKHLREQARSIAVLSLGLVGTTTAAVAVVVHALIPEMGWAGAVALGAIVSPTDAVAASAVFRRVGAPERVAALVEGESLINDGTGLAIYAVAVGAVVGGGIAFGEAALEFVAVGALGTAIGLALGWVVRHIRRAVDDPLIEITLTLLTPYLAFVLAEELHVSGILAAVASGLYLGPRAARDFSPSVRLQATTFWTIFTFLLESILFIILGLQAPEIVEAAGSEVVLPAVAVSLAVVLVRLAFFAVGIRGFSARERLVMGWSGMRGAISLAAALSIPVATDAGEPFPEREAIIVITLVVIGVTLLAQGLTLPAVVRRLGVVDREAPGGRRKAQARFATVQAALRRVSELGFDGDAVPSDLVERARDMYTERARQLTTECRTGAPVAVTDADTRAWLRLRRDLLEVERMALIDLRDDGFLPIGVIREVERDLDLEETRVRRLEGSEA